ncbi:DUF7282 domain-containing protein [Salinisphaera aquimarina]|uniref:DUF7282 domain-containing protein n=1 Tax=Salinisphaera aquimarina TaxID=2094031 RepID=A0ABV7ELD4_9GAMM
MKNQTHNRTLAAAMAVSLIAGSGMALAASDSGDSMGSNDSSMMSKDSVAKDSVSMKAPMLEVADQKIADDTVVIKDLYVPQDGYLVIHAADADGKLKAPESIGHMMIRKGEHADVKIKLDEPVESGDKLFAMLHDDTGAHGSYEFAESGGKKDGAMKADNKPVIKPFMVQ